MKEEITRILRLVQQGKITPEDAADLIEALQDMPPRETPGGEARADGPAEGAAASEGPGASEGRAERKDVLGALGEAIDRLTKEISTSVDWREIAGEIRKGARQGLAAVKRAVEEAKKGNYGFLFGNVETVTRELPLTVPSGKVLRIDHPAGRITVRGTDGLGSVAATARISSPDPGDAKAKAREYTLILEESDQAVVLRQPTLSGLSVDLEIAVAAETPIEITGGDGDVRLERLRAAARVTLRNGNVAVDGHDGALQIRTGTGDVHIVRTATPGLQVESRVGDITLEEVRGPASLRCASGDVRLLRCSGRTLSVEAVSGDVFLDLDQPVAGAVNVRTVQGDATIEIEGGSDCRVSLSSLRGRVDCALELLDEQRSESHTTGRLGDGSGSLDASAVNGDVRLRLRSTMAV